MGSLRDEAACLIEEQKPCCKRRCSQQLTAGDSQISVARLLWSGKVCRRSRRCLDFDLRPFRSTLLLLNVKYGGKLNLVAYTLRIAQHNCMFNSQGDKRNAVFGLLESAAMFGRLRKGESAAAALRALPHLIQCYLCSLSSAPTIIVVVTVTKACLNTLRP